MTYNMKNIETLFKFYKVSISTQKCSVFFSIFKISP